MPFVVQEIMLIIEATCDLWLTMTTMVHNASQIEYGTKPFSIFVKYWPIYTILSPWDWKENLQQNDC